MISMTSRDCRPLSLRHVSNLLQSLGHPIRLQILDALRHRELPVAEIVARLHLQQPVVSRHLAILRRAGIVIRRPSGRERVYRLADAQARTLVEVLFTFPSEDTPNLNGAAA